MTAPKDPTDNSDLDAYLAGGSEISRRYQALPHPQPTRTLDRAVLTEARTAASPATPATPFRPRRARWMVPFAAAATVLLSFAIFRDAGMNSHAPVYAPVVPAAEPTVAQQAETDKQMPAPRPASPVASDAAAPQPQANAPVAPEVPEPAKARGRAFRNIEPGAPLPAAEKNELQSVVDAKEEVRESGIEAPPPSALRLSAPASAPVAETVLRSEGRSFRAKAVSSTGKTVEEESLAAIRLQLNAGNKDQALASFKTFLLEHPDYFKERPEVAKTFPEFAELLK